MYVGFMDLEKAYDIKAVWQVLRMYDVDGKHLNGIKVCMLVVKPV